MHKPNKIPGMKLKGIDRKRDRSEVYAKHNRSFVKEQAKVKKAEREEAKRDKNELNNRPSRNDSTNSPETWSTPN